VVLKLFTLSRVFMEAQDLISIESNDRIEQFNPGDTVKVSIKVREGDRERTQVFQGVVIRKRGSGPGASFTVRRVTYEIGVERTFLINSPVVESVQVVRRGAVRRSRLYYLRGLSGRAARIREKGRR
jgi:large subunit ribosomal protein L19